MGAFVVVVFASEETISGSAPSLIFLERFFRENLKRGAVTLL